MIFMSEKIVQLWEKQCIVNKVTSRSLQLCKCSQIVRLTCLWRMLIVSAVMSDGHSQPSQSLSDISSDAHFLDHIINIDINLLELSDFENVQASTCCLLLNIVRVCRVLDLEQQYRRMFVSVTIPCANDGYQH